MYGRDGNAVWKGKALDGSLESATADRFYLTDSDANEVIGYTVSSGEKSGFRLDLSDDVDVEVAEVGGKVLVAASDDRGVVTAYPVGGGAKAWSASVARDDEISSLGWIDNSVAVAVTDDMTYAFGVSDGAEKWTIKKTGLAILGTSTIIGSDYSDDNQAKVSTFNPSDGESRFDTVKVKGYVGSFGDGVIYGVNGENRKVSAYDLESGEELWSWKVPEPADDDASSAIVLEALDGEVFVLAGNEATRLYG
jgi:hypothetical protein